MSKCIQCGKKEAVGRSKYCGNSCKVLYNRKQQKAKSVNRKQVITESVNDDLRTYHKPTFASLPEPVTKLNDSVTVTPKSVTAAAVSDFKRTIKGMSATSRLTPVYTTEQDRQPVREMHELTAKPTGQTRPELMSMSAHSLQFRIDRDKNWTACPEYAELCRRLTTWSIDELLEAGHSLPCWLSQEQVIK